MTIHETYKRIKPYGTFIEMNLHGHCRIGSIPCMKVPCKNYKEGMWDIPEEFVEKAIEWRKTVTTTDEVIASDPDYDAVPEDKRKVFGNHVKTQFRKEKLDCTSIYAPLFSGTFIPNDNLDAARDIVAGALLPWRQKRGELLTQEEFAKNIGLSKYQIKQRLISGDIKGRFYHTCWYIDKSECQRLKEERFSYIGIYDYVKSLDIKTSFDIEDGANRYCLLTKLRQSSVAPLLAEYSTVATASDKRNAVYFPAAIEDQVRGIIEPYLKNYGLAKKRIRMYLKDSYWKDHPINLALVNEFCENKTDDRTAAIMGLLVDIRLPEITECTDDDIIQLSDCLSNAYTKTYSQMVAKFIAYAREKYECGFMTDISYVPGNVAAVNTKPYSYSEYIKMGYMCFDRSFIEEHDLINKALADHEYAMVWLYCAWHYVGTWRAEDIFYSIPKIRLPLGDEEVLKMIREGTYDSEASMVSAILESEIIGKKTLPRKTDERQKEKYLVIHIPTSLASVIGTIYSICHLHGGIKYFRFTIRHYREFFGEDYTNIFGTQLFGNRRANKSYLDDIAETTEKDSPTQSKVLGYLVGSYVRGHKEGGGLAAVTSRYLATKLDGYSQDEVIYNLMETGACSFVPYMLLSVIYGSKYDMLSLPHQTAIIKEFGVTPYNCEKLAESVRNSWIMAEREVEKILMPQRTEADRKEVVQRMMDNIGRYMAVSRRINVSCLYAARRIACPYEQKECMTCQASVPGRATIFCLLERLRDKYDSLRNARNEGERRKIQGIIDSEYLPKLIEMLMVMKDQGVDIEPYKKVIRNLIQEDKEDDRT